MNAIHNDKQQFRVRFTGYYWSGYSIPALLDVLPAVGDKINPYIYVDPPNPNVPERVVQAIKQNRICSCCGSQTPKGDAFEYVIYVEKPEDLHKCVREFYAGCLTYP